MKYVYAVLGILVLFFGIIYYKSNTSTDMSQNQDNSINITNPVTVNPINHATAVLNWGDKNIYMDPVGDVKIFANQKMPDIILVTDIHADHFSVDTLSKIIGTSTTVSLVVPQAVKDKLPEALADRAQVLKNGDREEIQGFSIKAIAMYNLPESPTAPHVKGRGNGYIVERDGFKVYIAGDTSGISEMRSLTDIDIAFVPMNLPYTMSVDEAADAVLSFKPRQVWPYHYRGPNGLSDVSQFKALVNNGDPSIDVKLWDWY